MSRHLIGVFLLFTLPLGAACNVITDEVVDEVRTDLDDRAQDDTQDPGAETAATQILVLTSPPMGTQGELLLYDPSGTLVDGVGDVGDVPNRLRRFGDRIYVVASVSNTLNEYTATTAGVEQLQSIALPAGTNPMDVAVTGSTAFVTSLLNNAVYVVDLETGSVAATIPVGVQPTGAWLAGDQLVVANSGFLSFDPETYVSTFTDGTLSAINVATRSVVATVPLGCINPQWVRGDADNLYVLCTGDYAATMGKIVRLSARDIHVTGTLDLDGFPGSIGGDDTRLFAGGFGSGFAIVDVANFRLERGFSAAPLAGEDAGSFAVANDGHLWVGQWTQKRVVQLDANYAVAVSIDVGAEVQDVLVLP
jgi:YVTN family beta-propeller protein